MKKILLAILALIPFTLRADQVALKNFRELLSAFETVTGVSSFEPDVDAVYKRVVSRLPLKGEVEEFSSPMLLALTELSGTFCKKLVDREVKLAPAERRFFPSVDFKKGPSQFNAADKQSLVEDMALQFWQRSPTPNETKLLLQTIQEFGPATTGYGDTQNLLVVICTQLGTSIGFVVQ